MKDNNFSTLGPKEEVLNRLNAHEFTRKKGGYQLKWVYLSEDLVVCEPKRFEPIYWDEKKKSRFEQIPFLGLLYKWSQSLNFFPFYHIKQGIKFCLAWVTQDPAGGPVAMINTMHGYELAQNLGSMMEPFMAIDEVRISTDKGPVSLSPALIRERCDMELLDDLKEAIRLGQHKQARKWIEEVIELDQKMWERGVCNLDFSFKNYRLRSGKIVLRDAGNVYDELEMIKDYFEFYHGLNDNYHELANPIRKNARRLATVDLEISEYYFKRAMGIYTVKNLEDRWQKPRHQFQPKS